MLGFLVRLAHLDKTIPIGCKQRTIVYHHCALHLHYLHAMVSVVSCKWIAKKERTGKHIEKDMKKNIQELRSTLPSHHYQEKKSLHHWSGADEQTYDQHLSQMQMLQM